MSHNSNPTGNRVPSTSGGMGDTTPPDLAFLVTHWLGNYGEEEKSESADLQRQEALAKVRNAASDLASAFSSLGAFGTTIRPSLSSISGQQVHSESATYSDILRQWSHLPPSHLESVAQAVASTRSAAEVAARSFDPVNLLDAAAETKEARPAFANRLGHSPTEATGDDIVPRTGSSILQYPTLLIPGQTTVEEKLANDQKVLDVEQQMNKQLVVPTQSSHAEAEKKTSEAVRKLLEKRQKIHSVQVEIRSLKISLGKQASAVEALKKKYDRMAGSGTLNPTQMLELLDEVNNGKQDCERVTAQLTRKMQDLSDSLKTDQAELGRLEEEARLWNVKCKATKKGFHDPFRSNNRSLSNGSRFGANPVMHTVLSRQRGQCHLRLIQSKASGQTGGDPTQFVLARKALLGIRLSHAATINTHLSYPVYCLRFDRTGKYFITGADDYLVKVFCLGAGQSCRTKNEADGSRRLRCNYGANSRGAVLVCSLRGHAGVINDIDVSSDNAFLATASVDGDVRVWGLRDGCPVAILRGHKGGANMVSWSTLTPYRLVSTGSDGFARVWDIRDASLKRYGAYVGKRNEYRLQLTDSEKKAEQALESESAAQRPAPAEAETLLPPLPTREGEAEAAVAQRPRANSGTQASRETSSQGGTGVVVPPLPPAVPPLPGADVANNNPGNAEIRSAGQFEANDMIDEGVKLLSKCTHGSTGPAVAGPGTRARRSVVNVICVARCPFGGQFSTGSDDGICRVWSDSDDACVTLVDQRIDGRFRSSSARNCATQARRLIGTDEPLLKLMGHVSAITDLAYSHTGDRLLSASQKDGVLRIWSLGVGLLTGNTVSEGDVPLIVIKLTDPRAAVKRSGSKSRRAPGGTTRSETSKVSCDVAVWLHDDSKIATSQSMLVKQSGSEIQPGSQYLFLWDSYSGSCLMGISGAHTMQCPVLIPHPTVASLVCTAAADGIARVWDWESGRCVFTYNNTVEFGPVEPAERGKLAGFLDGSFSPDGTTIVLTDDKGRVTILDSSGDTRNSGDSTSLGWMREQYFANDYYELFYDRDGYCVERGSERPPHLAPRGVRCNHGGSPWSDDVNEAFRSLVGPMPLPEQHCRWDRGNVRDRASKARASKAVAVDGRAIKVRRGVREFDPHSTIVVKAPGHVDDQVLPSQALPGRTAGTSPRRQQTNSNRESNSRYLDYWDTVGDQGNMDEGDLDEDDEDFDPARDARNQESADINSDDSVSDEDMELVDSDLESPVRPRRSRNQASTVERQSRAQRRRQRRDNVFVEIGSDDEAVAEYMSTNNTPSGPYMRDYTVAGHFWRLPGNPNRVRRKWLRRAESDSSYEGRKPYAPQLGDSVVYIPRAHFETIKEFPSLTPPWQHWPQGTAWPVVRCCVRGVRFRFPYEDYFRASATMCGSVVAVITLEVTGIPELSGDREFPWPKPSFVESTRSYVFEVSLFENYKCEFIFPEGLYTERLRSVEAGLRSRNMVVLGFPVSVYYDNLHASEDAPMEAWPGELEALRAGEPHSDPHLVGSGFASCAVEIQDSNDTFSPWELSMADMSINRPLLSDEDKLVVLDNLNVQCRTEAVAQYLNIEVDMALYSDYLNMVEVEMNLMFVKRRLESNYYASKISVAADLRLIRDNCIKYNGVVNDLSVIARTMCQEFEAKVLSDEERAYIITAEEFSRLSQESQQQTPSRQTPTVRLRLPQRTNQVATQDYEPARASSYSLRGRRVTQPRSELENVPQPDQPSTGRRGLSFPRGVPEGRRQTRSMDSSNQREESTDQRRTRSRATAENIDSLALNPRDRSDRARIRELQRPQQPRERRANRRSQEDTAPASNSRTSPLRTSPRRAARMNTGETATQGRQLQLDSRQSNARRNGPSTRSSTTGGENLSDHDLSGGGLGLDGNSPSTGTRRSTRQRQLRPSLAETSDYDMEEDESSAEDDSENESLEHEVGDESPEEESEVESLDSGEEDDLQLGRGAPARSRKQQQSKAAPKRAATSSRNATRRSNRGSAQKSAAYKELPSDYEAESSGESSGGMDDEMVEEVAERTRPKRVGQYKEVPSDFEDEGVSSDDEGVSSDDEDVQPRRQTRSPGRKRQRASPTIRGAKKQKPNVEPLVELSEWPDIAVKDITRVCNDMLVRMDELDSRMCFKIPVLEEYPEIATDYLAVVDNPMDLRTILEERLPQYSAIQELQEDLVLMFKNCCSFNLKGSDIFEYAKSLWKQTNEVFKSTCEDLDVMLPRRWKP